MTNLKQWVHILSGGLSFVIFPPQILTCVDPCFQILGLKAVFFIAIISTDILKPDAHFSVFYFKKCPPVEVFFLVRAEGGSLQRNLWGTSAQAKDSEKKYLTPNFVYY